MAYSSFLLSADKNVLLYNCFTVYLFILLLKGTWLLPSMGINHKAARHISVNTCSYCLNPMVDYVSYIPCVCVWGGVSCEYV